MAQMFTRTITTFKATAYAIEWDGNTPMAKSLGEAVFVGSNATKKSLNPLCTV